MVTLTGDYPQLERIRTGIYSLDHAVGNPYTKEWGWPLRTLAEMYGPPETGKTTIGLHIMGRINPKGKILLACLEGIDKNYVANALTNSGFTGEVEFIPYQDKKGDPLGHARMLTAGVNRLGRELNVSGFLLDSIAAVLPPARDDDDSIIGEGFMMDRAKFMKDMEARIESKLLNRKTPAMFIGLNHVSESTDPRKGSQTPGGTGPKFHSAIRINLWKKEVFPPRDNLDPEWVMKGFVTEGTVEKNRFGGKGRKFRLYIVPGRGVHIGMSALFDACVMGLAERTKTGYIKVGDVSYGRIGTFVKDAWEGKDESFTPFLEIMETHEPVLSDVIETEEDDD
jgi:RecA/RadA recombinase